jgi:hypothetical protein
MDVPVTEEMIARPPPEPQAIIRSSVDFIKREQATIDALTARVQVPERHRLTWSCGCTTCALKGFQNTLPVRD